MTDTTNDAVARLTDAELAAIRARVEAATRGPWVARPYMPERRDDIDVEPPLNPEPEYALETEWTHPQLKAPQPLVTLAHSVWYWDRVHWWEKNDVEFIAHARTDIPALLDELATARDVIADLLHVCERNRGDNSGKELVDNARAALHSATEDADDRTT